MGDRTWTSISFSGIVSPKVAQELVEELVGQGCQCDDGPEGDLSIEHLKLDTVFYDEECNYATMEGVEEFCRENHISYCKTWASGGGYGEGAELYNAVVNQTVSVPTTDGEAAIGVSELTGFMSTGKTLEDVVNYLRHIDNFRAGYPPLVIEGEAK